MIWSNVFDRAELKQEKSFLVHGGSTGIGATAIQLANAFGATVFAPTGSTEKCEACLIIGAGISINYKEQDFIFECNKATDDKGVGVILDMVAGDDINNINKNFELAAVDGQLFIIAGLKSFNAEINFQPVISKRFIITGSTLRARSVDFKQHVWQLLEPRKTKPMIHTVFLLMKSSSHIGKIAHGPPPKIRPPHLRKPD